MGAVPFEPPEWALKLKVIPHDHYQNLAMKSTPIHSWNVPGASSDFSIFIKRDDMTGSAVFGNKVRNLEFILADAMRRGCQNLITTGGIDSNHCRATAGTGALLGFKSHLFLGSVDYENPPGAIGEPNLLMERMFGATMYIMPRTTPYSAIQLAMEALASRLKEERGEKSAIIRRGGFDAIGVYGSMMTFEEMRQQGLEDIADDLVVAVGSGGTATGLAIANYLCQSPLKVHAVSVCDKYMFLGRCQEVMDELGVEAKVENILNIIDGYIAPGYSPSPVLMDMIKETSRNTGIVLDPLYTGKAVFGMLEEMKRRPDTFKGRRILFMHTGGVLTKAAIREIEADTAGFQLQNWKCL